MGRRKICRMVAEHPLCRHYKPQGVPLQNLKELVLTVEGLEALRLVDAESVSQADAAEQMGVSRPTLNRTLAQARRTVARALAGGMGLRIDGGDYLVAEELNADLSAMEDTDMRAKCMMAPRGSGGGGGGGGRGQGRGMGQGGRCGGGQGRGAGQGMGQGPGQGQGRGVAQGGRGMGGQGQGMGGGMGTGMGRGMGQGMGRGQGRQGVFTDQPAPGDQNQAEQTAPVNQQSTDQRSTSMNTGKIAITADGPTLDSNVDPRFGRAAGFVIVDLETMATEYLDNGTSQALAQGAGIQAAENVANTGAKVVLTGFVGPKAFQALTAAGVAVGQELDNMTIAEAVEHYKAGKVSLAAAPNRDAHSGMGGR